MASACQTEEVVNRATWTFKLNEYQLGLSVASSTFRSLSGFARNPMRKSRPRAEGTFRGRVGYMYQSENEKKYHP